MTVNDLNRLKIRPAHVQVEEALSTLITSMEPGDQLPPEPSLAEQWGVSRATLREVMRIFMERGILVRRQGVGTFVASRIPVLQAGLEILESLDRMAKRIGLDTKVAELEVIERPATPTEADGLQVTEGGDGEVLVVNRVISVSGAPVADLWDIVPTTYLQKEELGKDFGGSVLDLFLARGTPLLSISRTQIIPIPADPKLAKRLNVPEGTALLKLVAQLYSIDEKIVDYSTSTFVPGHFKFQVMRRVVG